MSITLTLGDCIEAMRELPDCSVDSIVCDPPYGLGFMGKAWDCSVPGVEWATECLRVLKPGGHLVAFGGTRTVHRLTCAIEDAGFEIRDICHWTYWSGFPKSHDISKAIDRAAGAEREVIGTRDTAKGNGGTGNDFLSGSSVSTVDVTAPATDAARKWSGWGTALKPAIEPAVLARKPFSGTVAANVQKHGTGALNIDACRIAPGDEAWPGPSEEAPETHSRNVDSDIYGDFGTQHTHQTEGQRLGRFPANLYHCAKPSTAERERGTDGLQANTGEVPGRRGGQLVRCPVHDGGIRSGGTTYACGCAYVFGPAANKQGARKNTHPTVKPVALMRWLCRLVTPPGGLVLDPFMGSGTTGIAAVLEGFAFHGIEREAEYLAIANARVRFAASGQFVESPIATPAREQLDIFSTPNPTTKA